MTDSDERRAALSACTVLTLSEAVEAGVIGISLYAARKAQQRDPEFPQPTAIRGTTRLFGRDDLQAWSAKAARTADEHAATVIAAEGGRAETWKPVAPLDGCTFSVYEASDKGRARSLDREAGGRQLRGVIFKAAPSGDGYVRVKMRCDDPDHGPHTFTMHKIVLTTFDRPCPDGMEACHSPAGPAFNWWPEGIRWDTTAANDAERTAALASQGRAANGRPAVAPKPPATCIRCGGPITRPGGRRCHECVAAIGQEAADLMRGGMRLEDANEQLGYGNAVYLHALAVRYGGWGQCPACSRTATEVAPVTIRERLARALRPRSGHNA